MPRQRSDPLDPEYSKGLLAFPEGFRMLAGNPFLRSYNASSLEQQAVTYVCLGTDKPQTNGFPNYPCPYGLRTQVFFPSCWDGKNLDSPDHKSHMAYPSLSDSGHCPSTHPKRLVSIFFEILWNTPDFADKVSASTFSLCISLKMQTFNARYSTQRKSKNSKPSFHI